MIKLLLLCAYFQGKKPCRQLAILMKYQASLQVQSFNQYLLLYLHYNHNTKHWIFCCVIFPGQKTLRATAHPQVVSSKPTGKNLHSKIAFVPQYKAFNLFFLKAMCKTFAVIWSILVEFFYFVENMQCLLRSCVGFVQRKYSCL